MVGGGQSRRTAGISSTPPFQTNLRELFCSVGLGSIVTNVPLEFQGLIWTMDLTVLYGEIMTWRHQPISPNYRRGGGRERERESESALYWLWIA